MSPLTLAMSARCNPWYVVLCPTSHARTWDQATSKRRNNSFQWTWNTLNSAKQSWMRPEGLTIHPILRRPSAKIQEGPLRGTSSGWRTGRANKCWACCTFPTSRISRQVCSIAKASVPNPKEGQMQHGITAYTRPFNASGGPSPKQPEMTCSNFSHWNSIESLWPGKLK